jgi:hypothetical protein
VSKAAAISVLDRPSAAANTIRQRNASACELFGRRAHRSSVSPLLTTEHDLCTHRHDRLQSSSTSTTFETKSPVPAD